MKKYIIAAVALVIGLTLFSGCASIHTWPDHERSVENKMVTIQEKIGDGLKTGAITLDMSQMYLRTLKTIRADYVELRDKKVSQGKWNNLHARLDVLEEEINRALAKTAKIEEPRNSDRIVTLQQRINDGRISGRLPPPDEEVFQARLDTIRRNYLRMTEEGRSATIDERKDISLQLDSLTTDLNKFR